MTTICGWCDLVYEGKECPSGDKAYGALCEPCGPGCEAKRRLLYEVGAILCEVAQGAHDDAFVIGRGPQYLPLDHDTEARRIIELVRAHTSDSAVQNQEGNPATPQPVTARKGMLPTGGGVVRWRFWRNDAPAPCEHHCWHGLRGWEDEKCCHCGKKRAYSIPAGHGPHTPTSDRMAEK